MSWSFALYLFCALSIDVQAQRGDPIGFPGNDAHIRILDVTSNSPDALVFVDSVLVGRASRRFYVIPATASRVHLTAPTLGAWSITPLVADLRAPVGGALVDTVTVELRFPYRYALNSRPFGAAVTVAESGGERSLGTTPLTVQFSEPLSREVHIARSGYAEDVWQPTDNLWNSHLAVLTPENAAARPSLVREDHRHRRWIDALALGVAGGAAAAAIHYKFKADRRYEVYEETGDPELRPAIKRLDVQSGVALGIMQVGLGVVAIRMILD